MKKILALALVMASSVAFAGTPTPVAQQQQQQGQQQQSTSQSDATNAGVTATNGSITQNNIGASMKDQGADAAAISAAAAIRVAEIQAGVQTRGLDPTAAQVQIAQINAEAAERIAHIQASQKIRNTPSVSGPPLVSSNDTCMGSASAAINAPGIGLAIGKTYTDDNCVMLKNSRELWNMGMKAASLALMCNDSNNREALELTGFECPQTTKAKREAAAAKSAPVAAAPQYTDPIVRARLGLPPLK